MADTYTIAVASPDKIAEDWCTVLAASGQAFPFQYPAWQSAWRSAFHIPDADLLAITVWDGDRLVAAAPFVRDHDRLVLSGDHEIFDYMDVTVARDAGDDVYAALLDGLERESWRTVVLWGLPEGCRTLQTLPGLAVARGWRAEEEFEAVCPRVILPPTWEAYLESLTKKNRHELRRKMRRFQEAGAGMKICTIAAPDDVAAGLDDFLRLHTISRHDKHEFMTAPMEQFFRTATAAMARQGIARLFFVELDGKRVAGLLAFDTGDALLLYNSGYDPAYAHASVGLVSKALVLRNAIEAQKRVYDFLRGAEPYKYDLGAVDREVHTLTLTRPT